MSESADDDSQYPPQVRAALDQLLRLRGVVTAECDLCSLEEVREADLGLFPYAMYPIPTLRRTGGGRPGEGFLQIEIYVSRDEDGWRAVEFLAWFFRDRARGGKINDFRAFSLPPIVGNDVQLGRTLRFLAELFDCDPTDGAPMRMMEDLATDLARAIDIYDHGLQTRCGFRLVKSP